MMITFGPAAAILQLSSATRPTGGKRPKSL
jgi:hypothetical protein